MSTKKLQSIKLVLISLLLKLYSCEENQLKIIKNEMSESMQEFSMGTALVTLSENSDQNVIADKLRNALNTKYGPEWFSLVGPIGLISHFNSQPNTSLNFMYGNTQIFLFKLQTTQTQTNTSKVEYNEIISEARKANETIFEYNYDPFNNLTLKNGVISAVKHAISYNITFCRPNYLVETHNCYFGLAAKIQNILENELRGRWDVKVGVSGHYEDISADYLNYYAFSLAKLRVSVCQLSKIAD